jgi:hypothetical protein
VSLSLSLLAITRPDIKSHIAPCGLFSPTRSSIAEARTIPLIANHQADHLVLLRADASSEQHLLRSSQEAPHIQMKLLSTSLPTLCLLAITVMAVIMQGAQAQPDIDGSGTIDSLQAPGGFPAVHLVGLANWGAATASNDGCPAAFAQSPER